MLENVILKVGYPKHTLGGGRDSGLVSLVVQIKDPEGLNEDSDGEEAADIQSLRFCGKTSRLVLLQWRYIEDEQLGRQLVLLNSKLISHLSARRQMAER